MVHLMPLMKYLYIMKTDKRVRGLSGALCRRIKRVDLFACGSLDDELNYLLPGRLLRRI